jgi:hypothetical protein
MKHFIACCLLLFTSISIQAQNGLIISEFMAGNSKTLLDDYGNSEDWIEIANTGSTNVNLYNWALTDNAGNLTKWQFPATNLPPGGHLIVFASNRDRHTAGQPLHTNFKLDAAGEYLALVRPDGSIATQFSPTYPPQVTDVSYGFALTYSNVTLVSTGATARVLVPSVANGGATLNYIWTGATNHEPFNAATWQSGVFGMGFAVSNVPVASPAMKLRFNFSAAPAGGVIVDSKPSGTLHNGVNNSAVWAVTNTDAAIPPVTRTGVMQFTNTGASQITVAADPDFNGPQGTIAFWIRTPGATGAGTEGAVIFDRRNNNGDVIVLHDNGRVFVQAYNNNNAVNTFESASSIADNRWHHVAYVYDQGSSGSIAIYIDGVLNASHANSGSWVWKTNQQIELGRSHDSYWRRLDGALDDVRIYNQMLPSSDLAQIMAGDGLINPADIGTSLQTPMFNTNASAFIRVPFVIGSPTNFSLLNLKVKYDDGFIAWINGVEVNRANAPAEDLAWNSSATARHAAANFESLMFGVPDNLLRAGTNILAIQAMNFAANDGSFLMLPELTGGGLTANEYGLYFTQPTPGTGNLGGSSKPGPGIADVQHAPNVPLDDDNLVITATVFATARAVTNVTLHYRVMFAGEINQTMFDDGAHGDGAAGDGIYGATIPASAGTTGQMVRYYITAADTSNTVSRLPLFMDPLSTAEYFGTVINPNYVTSSLPIVHLFAPASVLQPGSGPGGWTDQTGADSDAGGYVSVYYDGEFYDNVKMWLRGNTTSLYYKKSHRITFNQEHPFRHNESGERIRHTSFTADYPDPTYMRQGLSFWLCNSIGVPAPFYAPYRLQLNGAFYQLANHNDVHDEELLTRLGYDPNGAIYNDADTLQPGSTYDKKTRQWDGNEDFTQLANAISESLADGQRRTNIFDMLDLPEVVNYLAAARLAHENDDVWANMSVYHDNDGDGLWRILPFDMNLSWGAAYMDEAGSDPYGYSGIQVTNDNLKSFPLYGSSQALPEGGGSWNRLYNAIFTEPKTREMFLRRLRTVMDEYLKPPGTATTNSPLYQQVVAWQDRIPVEAALDRAWWGWPGFGGQCNFDPGINLTNGVNSLLTDFLNNRRRHLYGKHSVTNTALAIGIGKTQNAGIPLAQPTNATLAIIGWDYNPVSSNQDEEFVLLTNANNFAVDISGWKLDGGLEFKFKFGTVIPTGGTLYVSPDTKAFRNRAVSPRGGEGRFVVGPYSGHLNAWGESLTITDDTGRLVCSNNFAGTPSLAQQFLRVTEIMYNPSPAPAITNDTQLFEYVELRNISTNTTLNLNGVRFTNGVSFNFTGSAVTSLAPGQRVLVVRNQAALTARYGGGLLIAGEFGGALNSAGETLHLEDAAGEKILEFVYNNSWYPITDGLGFSLVIVNDLALWSTWGDKASWRASGGLNGAPGAADPAAPAFAPILLNEVLAHTDLPDRDSFELFNPATTNVNLGGWFLTDDFFTPKKYRIPNGTTINAGGRLVFNDTQFNTGANAFLFSEYGESAYLFSGDANTNLTGYYHGWDFKASPNGVSFGRYVDSQTNTHFVLQSTNTLNAANALPRVGPVVISEIMYHPTDLTNGVDNDLEEFIELQNITGTNVPFYCTFTNEIGYGLAARTNTWQLRNAVDFDFPTNVTLVASGRLLVVGFNPTNTTQLDAFRALYSVPPTVPVYGPWSGKLDNSGEQIEFKYPDRPDATGTNVFVPYVMIEEINYTDVAPWPTNTDGFGNSLQRLVSSSFGNDPTNWFAGSPTVVPANPASAPLLQASLAGNGQFALGFTAMANATYTIQSTETLAPANWQTWQQVVSAPTNRMVTLTNSPAGSGGKFFRIVTPAVP